MNMEENNGLVLCLSQRFTSIPCKFSPSKGAQNFNLLKHQESAILPEFHQLKTQVSFKSYKLNIGEDLGMIPRP